jgi:hypothetical protein
MNIITHPRHRGLFLASALMAVLVAGPAVAHAEQAAPAAPAASTYAPGTLLNAGNAQFRAGHPGRAVLDYERGLLLAPRDPDLRANLDRARAALALPPPPGGVAEAAARVLSAREWLAIFAAVAGLCAVLTLGALVPRVRRGVGAGAIAFALLGGLASASLWLTTRDAHRAVVIAPRAVARVSPFASADTLFTVPEGHTVEVLAQYPGHLRVEDGPGRAGWVAEDEVTAIVP